MISSDILLEALISVVAVTMLLAFLNHLKRKESCVVCGEHMYTRNSTGQAVCFRHSATSAAKVASDPADEEPDESEDPEESDWYCPEHEDDLMLWVEVPVDGLGLEVQVCPVDDDLFLLKEDIETILEFIGLPADTPPEEMLRIFIENTLARQPAA